VELKDLQDRYKQAIAIKETMSSEGWQAISDEIDLIYNENLVKLITEENCEARGILQAIKLIRNRLTAIISKGVKAHEEIRKQGE
jgi:vacuolar-type H+-ATPase subunit C/Vma6